MKIGIVRRGFSATGGAEAYLSRLAGGLAKAGHTPTLITSEYWPASHWPFGDTLRLKGATPTAFAGAFCGVREDFDVTFSLERVPGCDIYRAGDGVHAAWLRRRAAVEPRWRSFLHRWNPKHATMMALERQLFSDVRQIVANSQMVAREIEEFYDFPPERLTVIPNGLAAPLPSLSRSEARARLGIEEKTFCILFAGTGWERKGLRAATAAVASLDNALLLVAGRGKSSQYAAPHTRFLGPVANLPEIFSAADAFVLPTIYDPFSNACLEALAAGLPVVTTTANGFSEIITEGVHGQAVEPDNAAAVASALETWRTAPREEVSAACRKLAAEYSLERNVNSTIAVAQKVIDEKKG